MLRFPLRPFSLVLLAGAALALAGCQKQTTTQTSYQPGEVIAAGSLTYNVVQSSWRTELGDPLKRRTPQNRYLLITLAATNKGHESAAIPFFTLEGEGGQEYKEIEDGAGAENWFGLIREIPPQDTRQGNLVFDVPLKSYRLRLSDGGAPGAEKYVWVDIPLNLDTDLNNRINISVPDKH